MEDETHQEFDPEKLERVQDLSSRYSLLFGQLVYKPPLYRTTVLTRAEEGGRLVESALPVIDWSPTFLSRHNMEDNTDQLIDEYEIREPIEAFTARIREDAFVRRRPPEYQACWQAVQDAVSAIKEYAKMCLPYYFVGVNDVSLFLRGKIFTFEQELLKLRSSSASLEEYIRSLLRQIYKEDADFVDKFFKVFFKQDEECGFR